MMGEFTTDLVLTGHEIEVYALYEFIDVIDMPFISEFIKADINTTTK